MHPIGFTDEQMRTIKDSARRIPHTRRGRFLMALCDELLPVEVIQNEHVLDAIRRALRQMGQVA